MNSHTQDSGKNPIADTLARYRIAIFVLVIIVVLLLSNLYSANSPIKEDGKYLVYGCLNDEKCYTLRADLTRDEGGVFIDRLYFDDGKYIYLDCILGAGFCYELDNRTYLMKEPRRDWHITVIRKL